MFIANDGSMVCQTDVGNIYRWSGLTTDYADGSKVWVPLLNNTSLAGQGPGGGAPVASNNIGGWEHVLAPNNSSVHLAIFTDVQANAGKSWIWYSTNSGATWGKSNIAFDNYSAASNDHQSGLYWGGDFKTCHYKIAIDPANPNVAYCGMPYNSGNSAGAYTTLNKSGGSTLATWTSVKTSGSTPIPGTATTGPSCGLAIDASSGTTTIGGQTVTNRIIIPIPNTGIYESTDGGNTFSEIAASAMGASNFWVTTGGFTAEGVYYCIVVHATIGGVWRYKSGTWTKISGGIPYATSSYDYYTFLLIDPRNNPTSKAYLSVFGPGGIGVGYTSTDANTGSPPTWNGATGGVATTMRSVSAYDIGYINDIFYQGSGGGFAYGVGAFVDANGVCWWPGNQSLFYVGTSDVDPTPVVGPLNYPDPFVSWSMGRGMEATVSDMAMVPPGGVYPIMATQDLGTPMRGTFTTYPLTMAVPNEEWTCSNVDYAASDPSFIVARITGQAGASAIVDGSKYSTNYGADGSWTALANYPSYNATIVAGISNGSGGAGHIVNVTSLPAGGIIRESAYIATNNLAGGAYGFVQPYGTSGTTGTGGVGTYIIDGSAVLVSPGTTLYSVQFVNAGQVVAVDHDHWVMCPAGYGPGTYQPVYTTNATGAATWANCGGLPSARWLHRSWVFGRNSRPFAVGYGVDQGTVWAWHTPYQSTGTGTLYRSTDSGANFSAIGTATVGLTDSAAICYAVPGFPNELWVTSQYSSSFNADLFHVTNANTSSATISAVTLPSGVAVVTAFTMGAPATPGGYPTLYLIGNSGGGGDGINRLYQGTYPGTGTTVTWVLYGPTGTAADLPAISQLVSFWAINGDPNVYGRIYAATTPVGFAYYNP